MTCAQLYQRGVKGDGKMVLTDEDEANPAAKRMAVDDFVTIPPEWAAAPRRSQRRRIHNAVSTSGVFSAKDVDGVAAGSRAKTLNQTDDGVMTTNDQFMPGARQTFAALDFGILGALIEYAGDAMADAICNNCYQGQTLPDTAEPKFLLEAHIFKEVKLAQSVQSRVLCRKPEGTTVWTEGDWQTIVQNATKWCKRNNASLVFVPP